MKIYDICIYNGNEEIGGFHYTGDSIETLLKIIQDQFDPSLVTSISITPLN